MTAAERHPEPDGASARTAGPAREPGAWVGDAIATQRYPTPRAIRDALLPEQTVAFDTAFDAALTAARRTLDLDPLHDALRMWRRQALLSEQDPDAQREMLAAVDAVRHLGRPRPGSVPWSELRAEMDR